MNKGVPAELGVPFFLSQTDRKEGIVMSTEPIKVAEIFGENVFNDTVMQERLQIKVYK